MEVPRQRVRDRLPGYGDWKVMSKWWTPDRDLVLIHGDNLEVMASFKDAQADAVVTDPPYFLGFMGASWDSSKKINYYEFSLAWAREAYRVLKPGGHLVAFSSSRTYHRMASAIEDAGFEIRDCLEWIYGSGFPKAGDLGKVIDKSLGADREVLGTEKNWGRSRLEDGKSAFGDYAGKWDVTVPATEQAKQWTGWSTALKPAHEPIALARKPLAEKTVVKNVLAHGTGAINAGACQAGSEGGRRRSADDYGMTHRSPPNAVYGKGLDCGDAAPLVEGMGRWPANVVLTHSPQCEHSGQKKVKSSNGVRGGSPDVGLYGKGMPRGSGEVVGYAGEDGTETVEDWSCVEGCPVAELDQQSGVLKSGEFSGRRNTPRMGHGGVYGDAGSGSGSSFAANEGGASRFFSVFSYDEDDYPLFLYQAKAPPKERPSVNGKKHPTVKPVALMQWLVRLVCPEGGVVLDPFSGSGTTGQAALREGCKAILIEQSDTEEQPFIRLARQRLGL